MTEAGRPSNSTMGNGDSAPVIASEQAGSDADTLDPQPLPLDRHSPQLTFRAIATGMVLGGLLSVCNVYAGLKVGFVFNVSITAVLLSYAFWMPLHAVRSGVVRRWGVLENNVNQTAASSGAAVASAGLIAPIPAWTMLTGRTLDWPLLALWIFSVCLVGIVVAIGLRRQMIVVDKLRFPSGIANAETMRQMYARGREAVARILALAVAAILAAGVAVSQYIWEIPRFWLPGVVKGVSLRSLMVGVSPSPLFYAVGGLIGARSCVSLLVGTLVASGVLAPMLIANGTIAGANFTAIVAWMVWPGATLMVVSALVSFMFSWRSWLAALTPRLSIAARSDASETDEVGRGTYVTGLLAALVLSVALQVMLFQIAWWAAAVGVLLSFVLAIVAARVAGETGITPVGAIGKVTQLTLGAILPQSPASNLMAANVTGGAASQCADLLADLKCGHLLGASPRQQSLAQVCGALAGAVVGSLAYCLLIPDPATQLLTPEWPAVAAGIWKSVAELFMVGFDALPRGTPTAMLVAANLAIVLTVFERLAPKRIRPWTLSASSMGLALVFPAYYSVTIFVGGMLALALGRLFPNWSSRFLITICAGVVAGDTLTGVGTGIHKLLRG